MHKLTLDPSTVFGWCLFVEGGGPPAARMFYGTWNLTKDADGNKCTRRGQYAWNLWESFNALRRKHGIEEDEIEIVLEGESYGSQKSEAGRRMSAMWLSVLEMMCERKGLPYPATCPPDSWRRYFIDCTKAPKEVGAGLKDSERYAARRAWLKGAVLAECHKRTLKPKSDNEADALGMMFWAIRGGPEELERKRADKKARTAAKRAQHKLPLEKAAA